MNWGEVHNDHLQVAAETGLPGYALFLLAIGIGSGIVAVDDARGRRVIAEATFARAFRWPLATAVFVICLAQFPLELAAPRLMMLTLGSALRNMGARTIGAAIENESSARRTSPQPGFCGAAIVAAGFAIN